MRYIWLVAAREFAENAKTKGFWIGLILFPIMILIGTQANRLLKDATPIRHFVVVDQSEQYGEAIDRALQRNFTKQRIAAYIAYVGKHSTLKKKQADLEKLPASMQELVKQLTASSEQISLCSTPEGWAMYVAQFEPHLAKDRPDFVDPDPLYIRIALPEGISADAKPEEISAALRPYLLEQTSALHDAKDVDLFAAMIIPKKVATSTFAKAGALAQGKTPAGVEYWSINLADTELLDLVSKAVNAEFRNKLYERKGVDTKIVKSVQKSSVPFNKKNPKKEAGREDVSMADIIRQWAPIGFVYLLWVAIFTVSQMLLNNTIEEKSNRIIEVLLSSVTARELMWGKLLGIALVGLTMVGVWILSLVGILSYMRGPETQILNQVLTVLQTSNLIPFFIVYFLFGFLLYAGIFLSIGSICNTMKEAQNFMGPIMMIMMVPLVTMFFIPKDPNGTLATVLSWIPLYTPFVMMNRTAADPPMFDQVGTIILMIVSTAFVLWLSAKIFRIGILRSGQPPKLLELFRWIKSS